MKISICVPTYEYDGRGVEFLTQLFNSIDNQTYKNFNVIISDHSQNNEIKVLCDEYKNKFEILYIKNENKIGNGPHNTNNAIINSDGDIIKIMFQDDFFVNDNALEKIFQTFNNNDCYWVVNGCCHTYDGINFDREMIPHWNNDIIFGNNTISSPSVLSIKKDTGCLFDENLVMLMDCDMYYQLYLKYGEPTIINDLLITNRLHDKQISSRYSGDLNEERSYVNRKFF